MQKRSSELDQASEGFHEEHTIRPHSASHLPRCPDKVVWPKATVPACLAPPVG